MSIHRLRLWAWSLSAALGAAITAGCTVPDDTTDLVCPPADPASFRIVSKVLELRCGTLDCHGNTFRPLRIYGQTGLRRPVVPDPDTGELPEDAGITADQYPDYYSGGPVDTTDAELLDNARTFCGLEPERMKEFRDQVQEEAKLDAMNPIPDFQAVSDLARDKLTAVRKARLVERHKGGRIWDEGNVGDKCLVRWLGMSADGTTPPSECQAALEDAR